MRSRHLIPTWVATDLCSILGTRLAALAVPWLVLTTTGSATLTGLVAAAELLPMVLSRAFSGPLIDRFGAVRSAVVADAVSGVAIAGVPLLWTAGLLSFPALLCIVVVVGAARGPGDSAKQTMLPDLARASGHPLERVAGIGGTTERLASTVGLALGGLVVAAVGGADALLVTAAGFGISSLLVLVVLRPALAGGEPAGSRREGYLTEFAVGFRALRVDPVLVGIVIMLALTNGIDQGYTSVLVPSWVLDRGLGAQTLGWLFATFMIAAVVGAIGATALSQRLPRLPVYVVCFLVAGAPRFVALATTPSVPVVLTVLALAGFASGFINPILSAVVLERVPPDVRGRVLSLIGAACFALTPFGSLAAGALVDSLGLTTTLLLAGGLYLVVTVAPALLPSWRDFGRRRDAEDSEVGEASDVSDEPAEAPERSR